MFKSSLDETVILSDEGAVVMIDQGYWEKIQETLRLFHDKKSLAVLLAGHQQREQNLTPPGKTIINVFHD